MNRAPEVDLRLSFPGSKIMPQTQMIPSIRASNWTKHSSTANPVKKWGPMTGVPPDAMPITPGYGAPTALPSSMAFNPKQNLIPGQHSKSSCLAHEIKINSVTYVFR